jgi:hypothetical protein
MIGIRRIMKGLGSAAILRAAICPMSNEKFRDGTLKRCGSHVEGRIAAVKVVRDFGKKEVGCSLT